MTYIFSNYTQTSDTQLFQRKLRSFDFNEQSTFIHLNSAALFKKDIDFFKQYENWLWFNAPFDDEGNKCLFQGLMKSTQDIRSLFKKRLYTIDCKNIENSHNPLDYSLPNTDKYNTAKYMFFNQQYYNNKKAPTMGFQVYCVLKNYYELIGQIEPIILVNFYGRNNNVIDYKAFDKYHDLMNEEQWLASTFANKIFI